ncbi:MAG: hypothetical protein BGO31_12645 [Bacteroidetes bacterium 43-16]|nr:MAG: hypothetical protein BGO31_12645 [Bacteroidetes bacterium 43-16]
MNTNNLILKITQTQVWYNEHEFIPIEHTDIPYLHLKFKTNRDIFWLTEMTGFNKEYGRLSLVVLDYDYGQRTEFKNRRPNSEVKFLLFGRFDWNRLEPLVYYHHKIMFKDRLLNADENPYARMREQAIKDVQQSKQMPYEDFVPSEQAVQSDNYSVPQNIEFSEEFDVELENCIFSSGYVECVVYIRRLSGTFGLNVYNESILEEFESVKSWFARKLGKSTFRVVAKFTSNDSGGIEYEATCEDFEKIDSEFIDGVKIFRTQSLVKAVRDETDNKVLFTSQNLYDSIGETEGSEFQHTEKEIIDVLMKIDGVRNQAELKYLADSRQSLNHRIRFTTQPHFGFLFTVEGNMANHFVWELLESHATYIWTMARAEEDTVEMQWEKVSTEIGEIIAIGREAYKRAYKDFQSNRKFSFNAIRHRLQESSSADAYSKWLASINQILR